MNADACSQLYEATAPRFGERLRSAESLGRYTSYRIGGPADLFLDPADADDLCFALAESARLGIPVTRLGGGTNILISDRGVRGLVVRLGRAFDYRNWHEETRSRREDGNIERRVIVDVGGATRLAKLVSESVAHGYAGLEFAAGIPGTVAGGALMNAGAFGGEIGDAIQYVEGVTLAGEKVRLDRARLGFSYRNLALDVELVITSVRFSLLRSSVGRLKGVVDSVQTKRRRKQPLGVPNAGSVFKNPHGEYAGKLIEAAGLKGKTIGRAQVSPDHANFIVNLGGAKAADVRSLMGFVQDEVWKRSGVWLEPEVKLIGDWDETAASTS
ncbi:MAG: UDP-N-acetylmuramate dehydrogenase [Candidatus Binatia bacterium]